MLATQDLLKDPAPIIKERKARKRSSTPTQETSQNLHTKTEHIAFASHIFPCGKCAISPSGLYSGMEMNPGRVAPYSTEPQHRGR